MRNESCYFELWHGELINFWSRQNIDLKYSYSFKKRLEGYLGSMSRSGENFLGRVLSRKVEQGQILTLYFAFKCVQHGMILSYTYFKANAKVKCWPCTTLLGSGSSRIWSTQLTSTRIWVLNFVIFMLVIWC